MGAFPRDGSVKDQMEAVKKVMNKCTGLNMKFFDRMPTHFSLLPTLLGGQRAEKYESNTKSIDEVQDKSPVKVHDKSPVKVPAKTASVRPVIVFGDGLAPETIVSCRILQALLQRESEVGVDTCTVGWSLTKDELASCSSAKYVFVLLTNGLMSNPAAMALMTLLASQKKCPEFVPCTVDRSFCFPSVSFYADIVQGNGLSADFVAAMRASVAEVDPVLAQQSPLKLSSIADAYKELFTKMSLPFSPQASKDVINVEVQGLIRRLKIEKSFKPGNLKTHPSGLETVSCSTTLGSNAFDWFHMPVDSTDIASEGRVADHPEFMIECASRAHEDKFAEMV